MKKLLPFALFSGFLGATESINLGENADGKLIFTGENTAFIAGNKGAASLQKVNLINKQAFLLKLPENPIAYTTGKLANYQEPQAFVLNSLGVFHVNETTASLLVKEQSIITKDTLEQFQPYPFSVDINGDGLTDFFLPGIESQTLYLQQKNGEFERISLPLKAKTNAAFNNGNLTVSYQLPTKPVMTDVTGDSIADLVFYDKSVVQFFAVTEQGISPELKTLISFESQAKGSQEYLSKFTDLNNDGLPDLYTKQSASKSADGELDFDAEITHRIYFSTASQNGLLLGAQPDIRLTLEGASAIANMSDFNGDGIADLALTSIDIGFTDILSMANAAMNNKEIKLDTEVHVYEGKGNYLFAKKAAANKDFEIAIKMDESNAESGNGIFFKDFDGDGLTDVMTKTDSDELSIYLGEEKRVLSRRAKTIKHTLPKSIQDLYTIDIGQNNKEDIVFKLQDKQGHYRLEFATLSSSTAY